MISEINSTLIPNDINIIEAVLHVLDNNSEQALLNNYKLELSEEKYKFIYKHINKVLKDKDLKFARFSSDSVIQKVAQKYLNGEIDIIEASKIYASSLFFIMTNNINIDAGDFVTISACSDQGNLVCLLKLDYIKHYKHQVNTINNKFGIDLVEDGQGLPSDKKVLKAAVIFTDRENDYDLLILDKVKKSKAEEYNQGYFTENFLRAINIEDSRIMTNKFIECTEKWIRNNINQDAAKANEMRKMIRTSLKEDSINLYSLADSLFKSDEREQRSNFFEYLYSNELQDDITVDHTLVNKKLDRITFKIDSDLEVKGSEDAFNDINRFEIQNNGDGSINIILKNIVNFIENK